MTTWSVIVGTGRGPAHDIEGHPSNLGASFDDVQVFDGIGSQAEAEAIADAHRIGDAEVIVGSTTNGCEWRVGR